MNGFQYPSLEIQVRSAEAGFQALYDRPPTGNQCPESLAATASQVSTDLFEGKSAAKP